MDRRSFLGSAALVAAPRIVFAQAATDRRFVFVIQRGAADGLNTVIPHADPAYASARGALAIEAASALKLDDTFALHPSLSHLRTLYAAGQATLFHAVASAYRDRSHFDGQNVLETGGSAPYQVKDGWMNRLLSVLPSSGKEAIAFSPTVPMAFRGAVPVTSYAPSALPQANDDLMMRVEQLYAQDELLHGLWSSALEARGMAGAKSGEKGGQMGGGANRQDATALGRMAAGFLGRSDGPRVALIETSGWDTHSGQAARQATQLRNLDQLLAGLQDGLGAVWDKTVVLVATEFGRTVAANGTGGTDHGTGAVAMLIGGAVAGGRIVADWPGIASANLLEGRDLRPTLALEALITAACAESFGLESNRLSSLLFPYSGHKPLATRLLRS